jgi:hypothetical protein
LELEEIIFNNKVWWSASPTATAEQIRLNREREPYFTFYSGTPTQNADPTMQSGDSSGNKVGLTASNIPIIKLKNTSHSL